MLKKVAVIILAAGNSSRMGSPKQLLPVGKTTILGVVIENALQSIANHVFCVLGANADQIKPSIEKYDTEILINSNFKDGLSSSIVVGINRIKEKDFDAVLIMLGDQPLVKSSYLTELVSTFEKYSEKIIATSYNSTLGVPVIIPKSYYSDLFKLKGDKGAKEFLISQSEDVICLKNDSLFDVDTPADYKKLIEQLNIKN